ncbi:MULTISPECIES: lipid-A-disaccharide synthase [Brucella/Ochrobactrum group]|uniref:Lipid-A-disaccharide synthase n=1 Tax=Ochrobactrum teleogrylli TaxID=2479765 RepID=A0ABD5JUF4_9HYPH|nr:MULTISPECIES: lipid-A-disaccharide synthase [Brucella]MCI1001903.1 lipid-A-disaccharide synthase [Ochrobactrum sp. C6C9]RRD23341.1 lipid-A-disaccharide synthase [Brucellaceae bacterium VT-16-1752]WHT42430.1 lipid-A-disaccharide synthase [Ochrobactrum sp. SSR]MDX4073247.1 lipid-A-disaccharide synthase [Brucella sp. NBRC 113783]RLL76758.1 lipid-A-disaccharide synthase [[Ochrobactrum] soli]
MSNTSRPLKIAIVAGEESGDLLGADLIDALRLQTDRLVDLVGVGGDHLAARGLKTFFDPHEIALMGLGAIIKNLPGLVLRIRQTARQIVAEKPDCVLLIDSPDFTHRVAKKIRAADPSIPIVKYIAPSVWAWRPQRARAMRAYIDHVLTVLPFEVDVMERLNGPQATYVGHRLSSYAPIIETRAAQLALEPQRSEAGKHTLLLLPGSRRTEIQMLMEPFGRAVEELSQRVEKLEVILPTLPRIEAMVRDLSRDWAVKPLIVVGDEEKWKAFARADAALAASGTVSLELALSRIPSVLSYKADWFARKFLMPKITIWSAALPNIIADEPVVPEFFNEFVRPGMLARNLERLMRPGSARQAQLDGFDAVASVMATERPSGEIGARVLLDAIEKGRKG